LWREVSHLCEHRIREIIWWLIFLSEYYSSDLLRFENINDWFFWRLLLVLGCWTLVKFWDDKNDHSSALNLVNRANAINCFVITPKHLLSSTVPCNHNIYCIKTKSCKCLSKLHCVLRLLNWWIITRSINQFKCFPASWRTFYSNFSSLTFFRNGCFMCSTTDFIVYCSFAWTCLPK
jgi:hypothetical protein